MNRRSKGRLRQWLFERFRKRASPEDILKVDKRLNSMKRGPIKKRWGKVQALWEFASSAKAPWVKKTIAIAALVYLITPLDAIPDPAPVVGLIDDAIVILQAFRMLFNSDDEGKPAPSDIDSG